MKKENFAHFKMCPTCGFVWKLRNDFLSDPLVVLIGYQQNGSDPLSGHVLFNHSCSTTMAILLTKFVDLADGLPSCERTRYGACVGDLIHIIKKWPEIRYFERWDRIKKDAVAVAG